MMSKVIWIYLAGSDGKKAQNVIGIVYLFLFVLMCFYFLDSKSQNLNFFYFLLFYFICFHFPF